MVSGIGKSDWKLLAQVEGSYYSNLVLVNRLKISDILQHFTRARS